eukprot:9153811-Pyramimonas_sp.AAC.1
MRDTTPATLIPPNAGDTWHFRQCALSFSHWGTHLYAGPPRRDGPTAREGASAPAPCSRGHGGGGER